MCQNPLNCSWGRGCACFAFILPWPCLDLALTLFFGEFLANIFFKKIAKKCCQKKISKKKCCQKKYIFAGKYKIHQKTRTKQGPDKVNLRLRQSNHNLNLNYNLMGFDTIEINLVWHMINDIRSLILNHWYLIIETWSMIFDNWYLLLDTWS